MQGKKIKIPLGANCYRCKSNQVKFYNSNSEKRFKEILGDAKEVSFPNYERFIFWTYYGAPEFYDSKGNILKTGGNL